MNFGSACRTQEPDTHLGRGVGYPELNLEKWIVEYHVGYKNMTQSCANTEDCEHTSRSQLGTIGPDAGMQSNRQGPCNGRDWTFLSIREILRNLREETSIHFLVADFAE